MLPEEIVNKMYQSDAFSKWLGIEVISVKEGYSKLRLTVRNEMTNGFGIAHGGITYSIADSALAFASNSKGNHALSIETSISHIKPVHPNDVLTATAIEIARNTKIGQYQVEITNQNLEIVAHFKGTVYIKKEIH